MSEAELNDANEVLTKSEDSLARLEVDLKELLSDSKTRLKDLVMSNIAYLMKKIVK